MPYDIDVPVAGASRSAGTTEVQRLQAIENALNDTDTRLGTKVDGSDIGVTVQGYDADLSALAAITGVQGDVIYHNGTSWTRLAKGTAGQVLTVNSGATAPEWAAASGGSGGSSAFVGARAYRTTNTSITNATWTPLPFDLESFDTDSFHDTATNPARFTIPSGKAGKYRATAYEQWEANATGSRYRSLAKNGTRIAHLTGVPNASGGIGYGASDVIDLAVGDYVELQVYQDSGASRGCAGYMVIEFLGT